MALSLFLIDQTHNRLLHLRQHCAITDALCENICQQDRQWRWLLLTFTSFSSLIPTALSQCLTHHFEILCCPPIRARG